MPDDAFGPWTPPGTGGGGASTSTPDPGLTTPATVDGVPFWDASTYAYVQTVQPGPWQRCKLGPHQLPGLVTVAGQGAERKIDVKDASGKQGATITVKGWSPASLTITCVMWTHDQFMDWRTIRADIKGKDGSSDPLDIVNPIAEDAGIRSVIVKRIGLLEPGPVEGTRKVAIEVIEWVAKPKTTGTSTPSGSTAGGKNLKDAQNAYLAMGGEGGNLIEWHAFLTQNGLPLSWPCPPGTPSKDPPPDPGDVMTPA